MFIFSGILYYRFNASNSAISSACRLIFPACNPVDFTVTNKVQAAFSSELLEYIQKHAVVVIAVIEMVAVDVRPGPVQARGEAFPGETVVRQRQAGEVFGVAALDVEDVGAAVVSALHADVERCGEGAAAAPVARPTAVQAAFAVCVRQVFGVFLPAADAHHEILLRRCAVEQGERAGVAGAVEEGALVVLFVAGLPGGIHLPIRRQGA